MMIAEKKWRESVGIICPTTRNYMQSKNNPLARNNINKPPSFLVPNFTLGRVSVTLQVCVTAECIVLPSGFVFPHCAIIVTLLSSSQAANLPEGRQNLTHKTNKV
jgi:hypothetical protein